MQVKRFKNFWVVVLKRQVKSSSSSSPADIMAKNADKDNIEGGMSLVSVHDTHNLLKLPDIAKPLVAEAEAQARKFAHIAAINKKVHITRYNEIITECCSKL